MGAKRLTPYGARGDSARMSLVVAMRVAAGDIVLIADKRATHGDPRALVGLDEQVTKLIDYSSGVALE